MLPQPHATGGIPAGLADHLASALASGRVLGIRVVECPPSWSSRAWPRVLPPLLLALGLWVLASGSVPLGWGFAGTGLGLGALGLLGATRAGPRYELRARSRDRDLPVLRHASRESVETARLLLLRSALGHGKAPRRRRR